MSMGVKMEGGGGSDRYSAMSDINVTPLVDIMLVLLIIFMVTAPLMTQGLEVDLPKEAMQPMAADKEPLVISVNAQGNIYLEDRQIPLEELGAKVLGIRQVNPLLPIYVRGDRMVDYGAVIKVMGALQHAGVERVGLITELPD